LNKPIENYQQMEVIFGNGCATGRFAMGSSQPLGSPSDWAESSQKIDEPPKEYEEAAKQDASATSNKHQEAGGSAVGSKRKRAMLSDEDITVLTGMTDAVNNVAEAIRDTKTEVVPADLYSAVMLVPGFTDEALIVAYSHLADNCALGAAYLHMSDAHRVLWLRTFLAKHYYNN
jgi:hypothetical protein